MKHKTPEFIRKRHLILNIDGSLHKDCKTVSKAKKLSREIQGSVRGMGNLTVDRSEDPKPPLLDFKKVYQGSFQRSLKKNSSSGEWDKSRIDKRLLVKVGL